MKEFWDERYAAKEYIYGTKPNAFLVAQIEKINLVGKILFPSESGRDKALQLANEHQVEIDYQLADATLFDFGIEKYDVVAFIFAHFPKNIREVIHHKAIQSLKKGGHIILEAFNPTQINNNSGGPKDVSMLYTEEILSCDFKALTMLTLTTEQVVLDEGAYHHGIADVVRMVASKV
mgnify:CR=1 FL=1